MKALFSLLISIAAATLSGQFVNSHIGNYIRVISNQDPVFIGAGASGPCGSAYVCAVSGPSKLIWEKELEGLSNGFVNDIYQIDSLHFYATGLNWISDDIPIIESIFLVKMDVRGNVIFQRKYIDTAILNLIKYNSDVHVEMNKSGDVYLSIDKLFIHTNSDGQIIDWFMVNEVINDFKINSQNQIIYLSKNAIHIKDLLNPEYILKSGFSNLRKMELKGDEILVLDGDSNVYKTDVLGLNLQNLSKSLGISYINDFSVMNNKIYIIGPNTKGINYLFVVTDSIPGSIIAVSLGGLSGVNVKYIDVNPKQLLICGSCNYGKDNNFYMTLEHDYKVPILADNLKLSNYHQTKVNAIPKDTFHGTVYYSNYSFEFEYDITNVSAIPVYNFQVFSNVYDGTGCFSFYYFYDFDKDTLYPTQTITLKGYGTIYQIVSSLNYSLCLSVVAPNHALDANSDDNSVCKTLVKNINPFDNSDFQLYPNPASDYIHLETSLITSLEIYNAVGTKISTLHDVNSQDLNLSSYPSGIYYFKLNDRFGSKRVKIIQKL